MSKFGQYRKLILQIATLAFVVFINGRCAHEHSAVPKEPITGPAGHADANIAPKSGNKTLKGQLHFMAQKGVLTVTGQIEGLKPNSTHGFHIHEFGDCSKVDASSAGGHFSPNKGNKHGSHTDPNRHAGDLGNLKSNKDGIAKVNLSLPGLNLNTKDDLYSILGKSVIVHANADDFVSQPAGNSGARIGCGIIEKTRHN